MENAVEALKIAGGVLLFVLALTVSISCFSQANRSVTAIVSMRDRDLEIAYDQIRPSNGLTRTVGVETIVPTMYQAYDENIEIFFKDSSGNTIPIYYELDSYERRITNGDGTYKTVDSLDLSKETFPTVQDAKDHLSMILAGKNNLPANSNLSEMATKYEKQFHENYPDGFYKFLQNKEFEESLGEYYQGDSSNSGTTSTEIKKRVITYTEK